MDLLILVIFGAAFLFMILFAIIIVGYVWLQPVIPYLRAKLQKRDIVIMIGKDSKVRLIPAKYSSGVYTTSTPPVLVHSAATDCVSVRRTERGLCA